MANKQRFFYCPKCGGELAQQIRRERQRLVCQVCGYVMYENPVVGVAAIVIEQGKILLGRRAAHSTYPELWCIPCGYVEYDEDVYDAICREFVEETGLQIAIDGVFSVQSNFHNPDNQTVGIWFLAHATGGELCPGDDIEAVGWFAYTDIPMLAFPTDRQIVEMLKNQRILF